MKSYVNGEDGFTSGFIRDLMNANGSGDYGDFLPVMAPQVPSVGVGGT